VNTLTTVRCLGADETSRRGKPCCPFGIDCFYKHTDPDGTPHVFRHGAKHSMNIYRRHRIRGTLPPARFDYDDPIEFLQHIFENPITNLHATLDVIRASLPAFMERFSANNRTGSHDSSEDEEFTDDSIDPLETLQDNLVLFDGWGNLSLSTGRDSPQSPPGEPLPERAPSPEPTPLSPETTATPQPTTTSPSHSQPPQSQPSRLSSRFSTMMNNHSRQTFVIDISDEEEEEEEEEEEGSIQHAFDADPPNSYVESSDSSPSANLPVTRSSVEEQPAFLQSVGSRHADAPHGPPQCEHEVDPPFVTDGRGRVVWSSTRNGSGRGAGTDGRASRHSRTRSGARIGCPSNSSTLLGASPRGHAWGGQESQVIDGKASGREDGSGMD